jgi:hypothetical protein
MIRLPADPWAERHLLGAITYTPLNAAITADHGLEPDHFYHPPHARTYAHLWQCWADGVDPDPGLAHDGITGPAYTAPQISDPLEYAAVILDTARRRWAILAALGTPHRPRPWTDWTLL